MPLREASQKEAKNISGRHPDLYTVTRSCGNLTRLALRKRKRITNAKIEQRLFVVNAGKVKTPRKCSRRHRFWIQAFSVAFERENGQ